MLERAVRSRGTVEAAGRAARSARTRAASRTVALNVAKAGVPLYVPHAFRDEDVAGLIAFMRDHAFATIVSVGQDGVPLATHAPVTVAREDDRIALRGHLAKANPHGQALEAGETLVIFAGPHAYVSPRHYDRWESVPTWNYRAVHARGRARITERSATLDGLHQLVGAHEAAYRRQWDNLPDRYREGMLDGVVGFEMVVERLEGAVKASQNKNRGERERIATSLLNADDPAARAMGFEMHRRLADEDDEGGTGS